MLKVSIKEFYNFLSPKCLAFKIIITKSYFGCQKRNINSFFLLIFLMLQFETFLSESVRGSKWIPLEDIGELGSGKFKHIIFVFP